MYMKSNNDRSKTINRKTTKSYHHHDPLLLKIADISIEALKQDESHRLPVYNCKLKICLTLAIGL